MSEQRKAIIIATGMDNIQLLATLKETEIATGVSLERVKGLYTKFSDQQAALEVRKNAESLARLKINDDLKLAETERFFAAQRAMYEENAAISAIGGGSIPVNMSGGIAGAGKLAKEGEEAAKEMHGGSTIIRETFVLFREGMRGNFTRMIGSFTILIGAIGTLAAVVAAVTGAIVAIPAYRAWQAIKGQKQGEEDWNKAEQIEGSDLEKRIELMKSAGLIDAKQSQEFQDQLRRGDVSGVLGATNKLMPSGGINALARMSNLNKAMEDLQEQSAKINRAEATTPQAKYIQDTQRLMQLQGQMNQLNPDSPEWLEKRKEWNTVYLQQLQDIHDEQKQTAEDQKKAEEEKKQKQDELNRLQLEKGNLAQQFAADAQRENMQFPTLAQIARFGWTSSPRGGSFRTDAGAMAHELLTLEGDGGRHMGWQRWNRLHGNIDLANSQADREAYLKRTLGDMGYLPKDEKWEALNHHMQTLTQQIANVTAGKSLNVNINDVEDE